jgi:hypothetical protein
VGRSRALRGNRGRRKRKKHHVRNLGDRNNPLCPGRAAREGYIISSNIGGKTGKGKEFFISPVCIY